VTVYLSSPGSQMHADYLRGMPVLLSYAVYNPWVDDYQQSFGRLLIDSGAFSEMNTGKPIDGAAYRDWWPRWAGHADAVAGLDDIRGDWRKSLRNYELYGGFPTMHDSDPPELLADLVPIARERGGWLGVGLVPPRTGKERFVRWVCDNVPADLHVHGWALRGYTRVRRLDSTDSTNWFRDAWQYRNAMPFLTPAECVELVVKRYQRWDRVVVDPAAEPPGLFSDVGESP
jgi:hypothetical protein